MAKGTGSFIGPWKTWTGPICRRREAEMQCASKSPLEAWIRSIMSKRTRNMTMEIISLLPAGLVTRDDP